MSALPASAAAGLEQSVLAVLGSAGAQALQPLAPGGELTLYLWAGVLLTRDAPHVAVARRVSRILRRAFLSVATRVTLGYLSVPDDPSLTILNLLAFYMLVVACGGTAVQGATEFLLVSSLYLHRLEPVLLPGLFAGYCLSLAFPVHPAFPRLLSMGLVDLAVRAVSASLPGYQFLAAVVCLLYLLSPLLMLFPALDQLFAFAVFTVTKDTQLSALPLWALACGFWLLWRVSPDEVGQRIGGVAGANVATLLLMRALQPGVRADPAPVLLSVLVGTSVVAGFLRASSRA